MAIRPQAARWFELVVPRSDAPDAMETLARRGGVEFEWCGERPAADALGDLDGPLSRYRDLSSDYADYWPGPVYRQRCCRLPVEDSAHASVRQIEHWLEQATPGLTRLEAISDELASLARWRVVLRALSGKVADVGALARCGPALAGLCLVWPDGVEPAPPGGEDLVLDVALDDGGRARIGMTARSRLPEIAARAEAGGGRSLPIPDWLAGSPSACLGTLEGIEQERLDEMQRIEAELRALAEQRGVHHARATMERIGWFREAAANLRCEGGYCWITGWTGEGDEGVLTRALQGGGIQGQVALVTPPEDAATPSVTRNPAWLRPFEVFTEAVGVPGLGEADPTTWLALLVPLLFGYMCGDVGHGLVIAGIGLLLRGRTRHWPLFLWCGLSATGFGFVFGDVFGYEHIIDPLWLRPLEDPLTVLLVPVGGGALVLTLAVTLHTVQTCWRGVGASHGIADVGQLMTYWGCLLALLDLRAGWIAVGGVLLCSGNRLLRDPSPINLLAGLGRLLESTFSLLINTLSFARIGAFALAHAALESAIVGTSAAMSSQALAILVAVIGNLVVIALESLVVSIQTSRLVLYEFLTRFFEGYGRPFEPARRPPGPER